MFNLLDVFFYIIYLPYDNDKMKLFHVKLILFFVDIFS